MDLEYIVTKPGVPATGGNGDVVGAERRYKRTGSFTPLPLDLFNYYNACVRPYESLATTGEHQLCVSE